MEALLDRPWQSDLGRSFDKYCGVKIRVLLTSEAQRRIRETAFGPARHIKMRRHRKVSALGKPGSIPALVSEHPLIITEFYRAAHLR
jgi:hypothetical protein